MKRILLTCMVVLLSLALMLCAQAEDAVRIVDGDDSTAFLFDVNGQTLLLGYADHAAVTGAYPGISVDYVVICCSHETHVTAARELAEKLGAAVADADSDIGLLCWENGAAIVENYAFTEGSKIVDCMTFDCQGRYVQFRTVTRQSAVNVRKEPSAKAGRVSRIQQGTPVVVVGEIRNDAGELWYLVRLNDGDQGYIRSDLLSISAEMETVSRAPSAGNALSSAGTANGAASAGKAEGVILASTQPQNGASGAEPPASIPAGSQEDDGAVYARTNDSAINVRTQPSTMADRVTQLGQGIAVTVLGEVMNEQGQKWFYVQLQDGRTGYIRADLLEAAESLTDVVVPAKTGSKRYIGNKRTFVFHRPSCHTLPKGKNQVYFSSRSYALAKGYRPCENCDP